MKLNREQREAVEYEGGPLLIIAGAGTGKTTVITERIKYLIFSGQVLPSEILALTFTEKAAREMQERVDVAMPLGYGDMWISTFHSFCDRVLREEALAMGWSSRFKLMTGASAIQFVRKNLFEFDLNYFRPLGNPTKFVEAILFHFSRLQDEDVTPNQYLDWVKTQRQNLRLKSEDALEIEKWSELARAYEKYEKLKIQNEVFDFGDLMTKTLELFRGRPNVLEEYRRKFKHVLVDEYQDVNFAQSRLSVLLAGDSQRAKITVCGDDDQSIYRFRGAAISNIVGFRTIYPKARMVVLTKNYRSTRNILDGAYKLITNNNPDRLEFVEKIDKRLISNSKAEGGKIELLRAKDVGGEAEMVAKKITELGRSYGYGEMAILVRANNHGEIFGRELTRWGIPWQFLGPGKLFSQTEIIDLISYLKVLADPDDSMSFYRLLCVDDFEIGGRDLLKLSNYAKKMSLSLYEAMGEIGEIGVSEQTTKKIEEIKGLVERHLKLVNKETAGQLLYWFLEEMGLLQKLMRADDRQAEKKARNVAKFFEKLRNYENENGEARVGEVVDWIDLVNELGESPLVANEDWTENEAVNILTVHSSKGLEFPVVFMVNLVGQRFPSVGRREPIPIPEELIKETLPVGDFHLQEERRLFYVGMTRAKRRLCFSAADYYGDGKRVKKMSPFVAEALGAGQEGKREEKIGELANIGYGKEKVERNTGKKRVGVKVDYLSYSQIEAFRTCPVHYKLRYVLGLPTVTNAALSFGNSIHGVMKDLYLIEKMPDKKLIKEVLERNWVREGYRSKKHQEKALVKAEKFIGEYFANEYEPKLRTIALEKNFSLMLPARKGERRLKVGGRIDRIDETKNGIEIIDYKTGANLPTQKDVDHDLQLTIYALAATMVKEDVFGKKPEEVKLTLYYFDGQKRLTTTRRREQLDEAVDEIYEVRKEVEKSEFTCSGNYFCKNCEYKMFCKTDEGMVLD